MPTHNRAQLLPRAIRSVLGQTLSDFELIIVDDVSSDQTPQVVQSFDDARLVYLRHSVNSGAAASRNSGIRRAQGELIAFLDDDDEFEPGFLLAMHEAFDLAGADVGLGWCGTSLVEDIPDGEHIISQGVWQPSYENRNAAYRAFLRPRRIGTNCGITVRRCCFDTVGLFDEAMRKAEDTDFLIRMVRHYDFLVVPELLVKVHRHSGTHLTIYDEQMAAVYERIIEKNLDVLRADSSLWTALHRKTGWLYYHGGNKAKARYYMQQALNHSPLHLKTLGTMLLHETLGNRAAPAHRWLSAVRSRTRR